MTTKVKTAAPHPLDQASPEELTAAADMVKAQYDPNVHLQFHAGGLNEPSRAFLRKYLRAERAGLPLPAAPAREISMVWHILRTPRQFEGTVDVTNGKILHWRELPRNEQAPLVPAEMQRISDVVMASPEVKAEMDRLGKPMDQLRADPWDYGRDKPDEHVRKSQVFMYARNPEKDDPDSNPYAFPLDFLAIVDLGTEKVEAILHLPMHTGHLKQGERNTAGKPGKPLEPEYAHHLQSQPPRSTMKPLQVVQPEGPSFHVDGSLVEWEKWRFRVGFNWREGLVLHDITFDGRELFHRISLSEMFVPYGEPRAPLHRKSAFDLGNYGAGHAANNLKLGCDCLGVIKYFDGHMLGPDGQGYTQPNVVCLHEVDAGIQWKHTNWRTGNAVVVRRRQLVLQFIITVANYEYAFYTIFDQSAEIIFETLATGILSTTPIDPENKDPIKFATRVGNGVLAPYHQHIFNLRIDPCMDGDGNSLEVTDSVPMPPGEENPFGIGYVTESTRVSEAGTVETDPSRGRVFKIINPNKTNPTTLAPVGYKLVPIVSQKLLASPESWHARRSRYCTAPIWVTQHRENELYPSGVYTNQSDGDDGIHQWVARKDKVDNENIVVWHTFGFTHNPRPEDFPVMPAETARVALKPYGFFEYNPTLDVPPSNQAFNKSKLYEDAVHGAPNGTPNGLANGVAQMQVNAGACCGRC